MTKCLTCGVQRSGNSGYFVEDDWFCSDRCYDTHVEERFGEYEDYEDEIDYDVHDIDLTGPNCPYCGKEMGYDTYDEGGGGWYCNCHIEKCENCGKKLDHEGSPDKLRDYPHQCRECAQEEEDQRIMFHEGGYEY